ncbi:ABC transporter permease [Actinomadura spongiicola]|uniref:ABC transporter permease n=2 Tax=Actinomadura spongiicola TaxID=2303421 RepID=A0A372GQB3_9ACTN|nr:ABC transporter permease [Actinomadura spongiicola]
MVARAARGNPLFASALTVSVGWLVVALAAPLIAPASPLAQSPDLLVGPSAQHWFGTDELGRDVLSRLIWGARVSVTIALIVVLASSLIGAVVGGVAGYFGGWVDEAMMRFTDLVFAFPGVILALAVTAALGPGLRNAVIAVLILSWPPYARLVRGQVLMLRGSEFVMMARLRGASAPRTLLRDIAPNLTGPMLVMATVDVGEKILLVAAISFLGLGVQQPTADWGSMIATGTQYLEAWWLPTFPGLAIVTVVLANNLLGDRLRDVLDPRGVTGDRRPGR